MLEPEDAMKWWVIRPDPATFAFTQGDQIVVFAETHRMKVRHHTLVWGWSNPAGFWRDISLPHSCPPCFKNTFRKSSRTYRGRVFAWDVINEAFEEHGNLKDPIW
jgi:endo-1,4-beta-xylanase